MQIVLLVIDSGGIGQAPDAAHYGDEDSNTITHTLAQSPTPLPHLARLGLSRLTPMPGTPELPLLGAAARMHPTAAGKDTLAGHWEMMGVSVAHPFGTYPDGFPSAVVHQLERAFGKSILGNRAASGTKIIAELGAEHMRSGCPIVYTSADSVLQIAAHEDIVPLETLYDWCQKARQIMMGPHLIGRIIARPFIGDPGHFIRTPHRHDYAVWPPPQIFTATMAQEGVDALAIGKIWDIFSGVGFVSHQATQSNRDGLEHVLQAMRDRSAGRRLIFANLVDFDSLYGHRRDAQGYARALAELDGFVPRLQENLADDDQLWITADHGADPTRPGSDHTREDVPILIGGPRVRPLILPVRQTLADLAATLADAFSITAPALGQSFWDAIRL